MPPLFLFPHHQLQHSWWPTWVYSTLLFFIHNKGGGGGKARSRISPINQHSCCQHCFDLRIKCRLSRLKFKDTTICARFLARLQPRGTCHYYGREMLLHLSQTELSGVGLGLKRRHRSACPESNTPGTSSRSSVDTWGLHPAEWQSGQTAGLHCQPLPPTSKRINRLPTNTHTWP